VAVGEELVVRHSQCMMSFAAILGSAYLAGPLLKVLSDTAAAGVDDSS